MFCSGESEVIEKSSVFNIFFFPAEREYLKNTNHNVKELDKIVSILID